MLRRHRRTVAREDELLGARRSQRLRVRGPSPSSSSEAVACSRGALLRDLASSSSSEAVTSSMGSFVARAGIAVVEAVASSSGIWRHRRRRPSGDLASPSSEAS
ncbi:hypothetical protein TIFTF001_050098 [Ficus carica]|uniref:Uncharacterized protein n=1 Tax=Ficus carica TaxID=3494 RepID=A0AA87YX93_FICCA|nr:hypothetical protein TIFTF001_050098 [Ficus carica]